MGHVFNQNKSGAVKYDCNIDRGIKYTQVRLVYLQNVEVLLNSFCSFEKSIYCIVQLIYFKC